MKFLKQITNTDDSSTIAAIEASAPANGRKWGIHRIVRLVKIPAGVVYKSARTKGVEVMESHEYDARSNKQTRSAEAVVVTWFSDIAVAR